MRALLGLVFIVFSVAAGAKADSYLCIADQRTGFIFNKTTKAWKAANFNVSDQKYILARSRKYKAVIWTVTTIGEDSPSFYCNDDIGGDDRIVYCTFSADPSIDTYPNFFSM